MTRLYMYVADSAGYRVVESEIGEEENTIGDDEKEDGDNRDIKYDPRNFWQMLTNFPFFTELFCCLFSNHNSLAIVETIA